MGFAFFRPIGRVDFRAARAALEQRAARLLLALAHLQRRSGGHLENFPHAVLGLGGALQVSEGADPAGHVPAFFRLHGFLRGQVTGGQQRHRRCSELTELTANFLNLLTDNLFLNACLTWRVHF